MVFLPAVFVAIAVLVILRLRKGGDNASFIATVAFWVAVVPGALFMVFAAGEGLSDPGGWSGFLVTLAWIVPLVLMCLLAWKRPDQALPLLIVLAVLAVAVNLWFVFSMNRIVQWEDHNGPARTIFVIAITFIVAFYAKHRARIGGVLLLVLAVIPPTLSAIALGGIHASALAQMFVGSPALLSALLFLLAGKEQQRALEI